MFQVCGKCKKVKYNQDRALSKVLPTINQSLAKLVEEDDQIRHLS